MSERTAPLAFITDLDGCLLDERDYGFEAARPALAILERLGIPLVPCSSKTRAEIESLLSRLGRRTPFIAENGGAVVIPAEHFPHPVPAAERQGDWLVLGLGAMRPVLLRRLAQLGKETGARIRAFAEMTLAEVERQTGLSRAEAARALRREYDEPFLVDGDDEEAASALARAAEARGLKVSRGGRFHHLNGGSDKGRAARVLVGLYEAQGWRLTWVGLGDAENDLPMLAAVRRPIVIPQADGRVSEALARSLPGAEVAPRPGPEGWNEAVLAVLRGERLASVGRSMGSEPR